MDKMSTVGRIAFIVGLIIAVIGAFGIDAEWFPMALAILGLIVGFLNVGGAETRIFLLAAIGLIMSADAVYTLPFVGETVTNIMYNLVTFIAPAILVVALKALFTTVKD